MDALALFFFFLQALGITLGTGASTFAVMFYIIGRADGAFDASERRFMRAVFTTLRIGLFLIILSGLAITAAHFLAGEMHIVGSPAYLFKWLLVLIIVLNGMAMSWRIMPTSVGGALAGASWYALFVLHTLAPNVGWLALFGIYAIWLVLFSLAFFFLGKIAEELYQEPEVRTAPAISPQKTNTFLPMKGMQSTGPSVEFDLPQRVNTSSPSPKA